MNREIGLLLSRATSAMTGTLNHLLQAFSLNTLSISEVYRNLLIFQWLSGIVQLQFGGAKYFWTRRPAQKDLGLSIVNGTIRIASLNVHEVRPARI